MSITERLKKAQAAADTLLKQQEADLEIAEKNKQIIEENKRALEAVTTEAKTESPMRVPTSSTQTPIKKSKKVWVEDDELTLRAQELREDLRSRTSDVVEELAKLKTVVAHSRVGPASGPRSDSLGYKLQKQLEDSERWISEQSRTRAKSITDAAKKTQDLLDRWASLSDKLYERGNFPTDAEKASWLQEVQKNPYLAYDTTRDLKPPETLDEAIARIGYMGSEMTLGGAREVALPVSWGHGQPRRSEDVIFQIVGGLITPSPTDFVFTQAIRTLIGAGKKGTKILRKVMRGTALVSDEVIQFEKLVGQYGYSTNDLRKLGNQLGNLDDLTSSQWDDLLEKYKKYYDFWEQNPELYSSGAAYKPSLLQEFEEVLDDVVYDVDEYIDFLNVKKVRPTLSPASVASLLQGVKPSPSRTHKEIMEGEIENLLIGTFDDTTSISETVMIERTPVELKPLQQLKPAIIPDIIPDIILDVIPDIISDVIPIVIPVQIQKQEIVQKQILDEIQEPAIPSYPELMSLTHKPIRKKEPEKKKKKKKKAGLFDPFGYEDREYAVLTPEEMLSLGKDNKKSTKGLFLESKSKKKGTGLWV